MTFLVSNLDGSQSIYTHTEIVPPMTRKTVVVKNVPGMSYAPGFSTVIESDMQIVADRTMTWDSTGYGSHAETAIEKPAMTWYLAEGATQNGFQLYYLIANPNPDPVDVRVRYLRRAPADADRHRLPEHPGQLAQDDLRERPGRAPVVVRRVGHRHVRRRRAGQSSSSGRCTRTGTA